jgi:hypothetical protein
MLRVLILSLIVKALVRRVFSLIHNLVCVVIMNMKHLGQLNSCETDKSLHFFTLTLEEEQLNNIQPFSKYLHV